MNKLSLEGRAGVNSRPPLVPLRAGSGRGEGGSELPLSLSGQGVGDARAGVNSRPPPVPLRAGSELPPSPVSQYIISAVYLS